MSLITTNILNENYLNFTSSQKFTYSTNTDGSAGLAITLPRNKAYLVIKMWGGGGAGGFFSGNTGGGGGYTTITMQTIPQVSYILSLGRGGIHQSASGNQILNGGNGSNSGAGGGDASCIIKYDGSTYTLCAVAGGGGGGGTTGNGNGVAGAGGGSSGQGGSGTTSSPPLGSGGSNGVGGSGGQGTGGNCLITSATLTGFGGVGAPSSSVNGGELAPAGGGGYGGGGSANGAGAAGGGGFVNTNIIEYLRGSTTVGSNRVPANIIDADYTGSVGYGGTASINGNNGLIVIYMYFDDSIIAGPSYHLDNISETFYELEASWTSRSTPTTGNIWGGVLWVDDPINLFVAYAIDSPSPNKSVMTSSNGITWTTRDTTGFGHVYFDAAYAPSIPLIIVVARNAIGDNTSVMRSSDGIRWTNSGLSGVQNYYWRGVAWSPLLSLFVAVSDWSSADRGVMYSSNGISWTTSGTVASAFWKSVAWSPTLNLFAAVGGGGTQRVMTSTNGTSWTRRDDSVGSNTDMSWISIVWGNDKFVAVAYFGSSTRVMYSTNGTTWTNSGVTGFTSTFWYDICWSEQQQIFLAVAEDGTVLQSFDGISWTSAPTIGFNTDWFSITWSNLNKRFVATSITAISAVATIDLVNTIGSDKPVFGALNIKQATISSTNSTTSYKPASLLIQAPPVVSVSSNQIISSTYDANYWITSGGTAANAVCWAPERDLFVAVSTSNAEYSSTGKTWTSRSVTANNWSSVVWSPQLSLFVAVSITGSSNRAMYSSTGTSNWTTATTNDNNWRNVCWAPELGLFVAVATTGTNDRVMTSSNGTSWTPRTSTENNQWYSVCWAADISVLVAVSIDGTNRVMKSSNGISWNVTGLTGIPAYEWNSVCWSSYLGLFVAVAANGGTTDKVMTSLNGSAWTSRTAFNRAWRSVIWVAELKIFIAVASSGGTIDRVMYSYDGIIWTLTNASHSTNNTWVSLAWSKTKNILVAVADSGVSNTLKMHLPCLSNAYSIYIAPSYVNDLIAPYVNINDIVNITHPTTTRRSNATQNIIAQVDTAINIWGTIINDSGDIVNNSLNFNGPLDTFVLPSTGYYMLSFTIDTTGTVGTVRTIFISKNGNKYSEVSQRTTAGRDIFLSLDTVLYVNTGDYLQFHVYTDTDITIPNEVTRNLLNITKLF
jgi:hypothetical protein